MKIGPILFSFWRQVEKFLQNTFVYQTTRRHTPEDIEIRSYLRNNLKPRIFVKVSDSFGTCRILLADFNTSSSLHRRSDCNSISLYRFTDSRRWLSTSFMFGISIDVLSVVYSFFSFYGIFIWTPNNIIIWAASVTIYANYETIVLKYVDETGLLHYLRNIIGIRISDLLKIVLRVGDLFRSDENVPLRVEGFSLQTITSRRIVTADDQK
jgi:hypothetical protein